MGGMITSAPKKKSEIELGLEDIEKGGVNKADRGPGIDGFIKCVNENIDGDRNIYDDTGYVKDILLNSWEGKTITVLVVKND